MRLVLGNYFVEFEDGQEHRDHDAADDHAQENDQHWLDQRGEGVKHCLDFFVPEIGHFLEHIVDFSGGFTGRDHSQKHWRENRFLRHRDRQVIAFLHVLADAFDAFFDYVIAGRSAHYIDNLNNRHTAAEELG